jgi:GNAT superfamily N-acetyltransferase
MNTDRQAEPTEALTLAIRPLREQDLPTADRLYRLAFGTFLGLPNPLRFSGDAAYIQTRWAADPTATFGAELDGELVGSNFVTNWGSVGFFGPLTVHPDLWERGIAKRLLAPTMDLFARWGTAHAGLFTFPQSPKHIGLYQRFGFWPRFLTAIMAKPVQPHDPIPSWSRYSAMPESDRLACMSACRNLTEMIYEGLTVEREIRAVEKQKLGETVLLENHSQIVGLAVCHCGPGTEAGSGTCSIKFGAVRPGPQASVVFDRLLEACAALAAERGMTRVVAGVNTGCQEAYQQLLARGFRTEIQGVAMHRPNEPGYHRPGMYVLDDWR